jgi:2-aminoethylphosphonate-pyruvate transaminase
MADKLLFTPGPLTTSATVKQAMLRDLGSRDGAFIAVVRDIRRRLVALAGVSEDEYTAVPLQGSGTFGVEAALTTAVPRGGKVLVVTNGAYGARLAQICRVAGIDVRALEVGEERRPDPEAVGRELAADPAVTHVAVVHCETTTGMFNPVEEIGEVARAAGKELVVDAMSSFGAVPLDFARAGVTYLVSSPNKCIEGVPGFSFAIVRKAALAAAEGRARSLTLDLHAQWRGLEDNGQFRFTPPTHALLAFQRALDELDAEGGVAGRAARYRRNHELVLGGLRELGFEPFLPEELQGYIITSFRSPSHPRFSFARFYEGLSERGFLIYPGKVSHADCFRIGHIGRLGETETRALLAAIREVLSAMEVTL